MAISIYEAAKKICILSNWTITNLKLQKILYLLQVAYLGENKSPLFEGEFEAWHYGPVLPELYHKLKRFGADKIKDIFFGVEEIEGTKEAEFLKQACDNLLSKKTSQLIGITHRANGAWAKARVKINPIISQKDMLQEYEDVVNGGNKFFEKIGELNINNLEDPSCEDSLEKQIEIKDHQLKYERYVWIIAIIILIDIMTFRGSADWSFPLVILVLELILLIVIGKQNNIAIIETLLDKLMSNFGNNKNKSSDSKNGTA